MSYGEGSPIPLSLVQSVDSLSISVSVNSKEKRSKFSLSLSSEKLMGSMAYPRWTKYLRATWAAAKPLDQATDVTIGSLMRDSFPNPNGEYAFNFMPLPSQEAFMSSHDLYTLTSI